MSTDKDREAEIQAAQDDPVADEKTHNEAINQAKAATDKEHKMTLREGIRTYPKAIAWSMTIGLCIAMEGYDLCLLNTFCTRLLDVIRFRILSLTCSRCHGLVQ